MQVRAHAVGVLQKADDEELLCYLLQLVQALRYEAADDSPLASFLVSRARTNTTLAIYLHWCVHVHITCTASCSPPGWGVLPCLHYHSRAPAM